MQFVKDALSYKGQASSKRLNSFIGLLYFMLIVLMITIYLWIKGILENYITILLGFVVSTAVIPGAESTIEKLKKGGE